MSDFILSVLVVILWIAAIAGIISLRVNARKNTRFGRFCRWYWNTSFKFSSRFPLCGWLSRFIITDGDARSEAEKEYYIQSGKEADSRALSYLGETLEKAAQREREEEAARQASLVQQRREQEEDLRARAYRKYGTRNVHLNSDGSMVRVGDSDYIPVKEFERKLR